MDTTTFVQSLTMSDGSKMFTESTYSVAARAAMSRSLCFGGLSGTLLEAPTIEPALNIRLTVFSVDQDNIASDLTNGIYSLGGFLPTADVLADCTNLV
jgi:hypothetical protein